MAGTPKDEARQKLTWSEFIAASVQPLIFIDQEMTRLRDKAAELRRKEEEEAGKSGLGNLQHATFDQANQMLRDGRATKANAEAYVEMWNRPGMRFTRAELKSRSVPFGDCGMTVYYMILHED